MDMTQVETPGTLCFIDDIYFLDRNLSCDIHIVYYSKFTLNNWIIIKSDRIFIIHNNESKEVNIKNHKDIQKVLNLIEPELKLELL